MALHFLNLQLVNKTYTIGIARVLPTRKRNPAYRVNISREDTPPPPGKQRFSRYDTNPREIIYITARQGLFSSYFFQAAPFLKPHIKTETSPGFFTLIWSYEL